MKKTERPALVKFSALRPAAVLFAAFALVLTLSVCGSLGSALREPELSLDSVEMTGIDFSGVDLLCKVNVINPNAFDIPFPEIDWECLIGGDSLVRGTIKSGGALKSRTGTVVDVPVSMTYEGIFGSLASLAGSREADYTVKLGVTFAIPLLGDRTWNFEHSGSLPLPRLPSVGFKGIRVKNISLSRLDFEAELEVENGNAFSINIDELFCDLTVNNSRWFQGGVPSPQSVAAEGKSVIPLAVSIDSLSMVRDLTLMITTGRDASVALDGAVTIAGNLPGWRPLNLPFSYNGSTKLRR
ncbi:MAG: LEA type 2 family protein [Treponema sp.]|jgi:LEA14-like dessication related protein|nr:LEA type 2 family protein [Treponema sp.]